MLPFSILNFLPHTHWQNAGNATALTCTFNIPIPSDMTGPIYMYYEINGMYQNHRRYIGSGG